MIFESWPGLRRSRYRAIPRWWTRPGREKRFRPMKFLSRDAVGQTVGVPGGTARYPQALTTRYISVIMLLIMTTGGKALIRTQIQLTEEQFAALKALAAAQGISMAELIRRGVNLVLESPGQVSHAERIRRAIAAAGRFRSGLRDLSVRHDEYLAEAFAE